MISRLAALLLVCTCFGAAAIALSTWQQIAAFFRADGAVSPARL